MPADLSLLVCVVVFAFLQAVVAVLGAILQVGLPTLAGNREGLKECTGWAGRAARASLPRDR